MRSAGDTSTRTTESALSCSTGACRLMTSMLLSEVPHVTSSMMRWNDGVESSTMGLMSNVMGLPQNTEPDVKVIEVAMYVCMYVYSISNDYVIKSI